MLDAEVLNNTIVAYRVYSKVSVYGKFKSPKAKNRSFALKKIMTMSYRWCYAMGEITI